MIAAHVVMASKAGLDGGPHAPPLIEGADRRAGIAEGLERDGAEPGRFASTWRAEHQSVARGPRRCTRSPCTRNGSRLVAKILTPEVPRRTAAARSAAASMRCAQLSSSNSIRSSRRAATRPGTWIFGGDVQAKHGRYHTRHQPGIADRRRIGQPDAALKSADHPFGDGKANRALANTAGPDNRDWALVRDLRGERCRDILATDHPSLAAPDGILRRTAGAPLLTRHASFSRATSTLALPARVRRCRCVLHQRAAGERKRVDAIIFWLAVSQLFPKEPKLPRYRR